MYSFALQGAEVFLCITLCGSEVFLLCCIHLGWVYVYLSCDLKAIYTSAIGNRLGVIHLKMSKLCVRSKGNWSCMKLHLLCVLYVTIYKQMYPVYSLSWCDGLSIPYLSYLSCLTSISSRCDANINLPRRDWHSIPTLSCLTNVFPGVMLWTISMCWGHSIP